MPKHFLLLCLSSYAHLPESYYVTIISHRTFSDLAKRVYVQVAADEFRIHGRKQTVSRIAILTGRTRKDVQRLLAEPRA